MDIASGLMFGVGVGFTLGAVSVVTKLLTGTDWVQEAAKIGGA